MAQLSACKAGDLGLIPDWEDPLEKEMATLSSFLVWKIPWIEQPWGCTESDTTYRQQQHMTDTSSLCPRPCDVAILGWAGTDLPIHSSNLSTNQWWVKTRTLLLTE